MTPEQLKSLQEVCNKYRIHFDSYVDSRQWPENHRTVFTNIQLLGQKTLDTYKKSAKEPTPTPTPWKWDNIDLTQKVVDSAKQCQHRNDCSWRLSCESFILKRLSAEVVCPNCRKRLWRSEIEATRDEYPAAEALRARQNARSTCRCDRKDRRVDQLEPIGLNKIFGQRADEPVHYEPELSMTLARMTKRKRSRTEKTQSPDRIFGLRMTRNIEYLLHDTTNTEIYGSGDVGPQLVHEKLDPSPLKRPLNQLGDPLLFPFLVLEAKSGMSSDDWYSIQLQTALPIRAFLEAQNALRRAAGTRSIWKTGPLVWFFANRGDDWRLSAAYMQEGKERLHTVGGSDYRGSTRLSDGALQLLLLVDYIFDWARDIYRDDIIKELRVLASQENDRASQLYIDTDVSSRCHFEISEHVDPEGGRDVFESYKSTKENFMTLDSERGATRNANLIESRYCCVYVTRDNIKTLVQSIDQTKIRKLCSHILETIADSDLITPGDLNAIEEQWTGLSRIPRVPLAPQPHFYAILSSTTYLSGNWHLIRELSVIAVAENALPLLIEASKLKRGKRNDQALFPAKPFDSVGLSKTIMRLKAGSPKDNLLAAIQRRAVRIQRRWNEDVVIIPNDGAYRDIVHYIYKLFKKGMREPDESFLRCSTREELQDLLSLNGEPFPLKEELQVSDEGCVLVTSESHSHDTDRSKSTICAYFINERSSSPPNKELVANCIARTFATYDIYHTTRDNGISNIMKMSIKKRKTKDGPFHDVPWNIKDSYGICGDGFDLINFIRDLGGEIPSTQATPRQPTGSGSYLHKKNFWPWEDPRRSCGSATHQKRLFVRYKLVTREVLYWRRKAKERRNQGISCCTTCAKVELNDKCRDCQQALDEWKRPLWYRNALIGGIPIEYEDRKMRAIGDRGSTSSSPEQDENWREGLRLYPDLNIPFRDMDELNRQWIAFEQWRSARQEASEGLRETKRQRH